MNFGLRRLGLILAVLLSLAWLAGLAVGDAPARAEEPQEQPGKEDPVVSLLLRHFIQERAANAEQSQTQRSSAATRSQSDGSDIRAPKSDSEKESSDSGASSRASRVRFDSSGNVQVYIDLKKTDAATLKQLRELGAIIEIVNSDWDKVQAWVPISALDQIAAFDAVRKIKPPDYSVPKKGSVTSEGDGIHRADLIRHFSGLTGKGVKVGVISTGTYQWHTARSSGDLPNRIQVDPYRPGRHHEGTAMLEIIHDLAPEAELAASAPTSSLSFIQSVLWLANDAFGGEGADIIVDDLGFFQEPYFEDGPVAQAAQDAVDGGAVFVSSAGNFARSHYEADFVDGGDGYHDFDPGPGVDITMRIQGRFIVDAYLQWSDPWGTSDNDYDLFVCRPGLKPTKFNLQNGFCGGGTDHQDGAGDPEESAFILHSGSADVYIRKFSGEDRRLEMLVSPTSRILEHWVEEGGVVAHPAAKDVIAVGAIDASDPGNDEPQFYSDRGKSRIYDFDNNTYEDRPKPDVMGIDGVLVTGSGGFGNHVPGISARRFYGTSAAAPHVAGIAALLIEAQRKADPDATKKEVADATADLLRDSAADLGEQDSDGYNETFGYGRADALSAIESIDKFGVVSKAGFTETFTVDSKGDGADSTISDGSCDDGNGDCTLRAAIQQSNASTSAIINFNISGNGTQTIQPASALPTITKPVFIDGYSQPSADEDNLLIELDGTNAGTNTNGLTISGKRAFIRGLAINNFDANGIVLQGTSGEQVIIGNHIGTNTSGTTDKGNGKAGVYINGAPDVILRGNVISANDSHGVHINGSNAKRATIFQNTIGLNAAATSDLGNSSSGIHINGAPDALTRENTIAGNDSHGISLSGSGASNNHIYLNTIGLNAAQTSHLGNAGSGIHISSVRNTDVIQNTISGNDSHGVTLTGSGTYETLVHGNHIGTTDADASLGNGGSGVLIETSSYDNTIEANTIAYNNADGVTVTATGTSIGSAILQNSIYDNNDLGIDLNDDGVTANDTGDTDTGPNFLQNYPNSFTLATRDEHASARVTFEAIEDRRYRIDFYGCDSATGGEGEEWLGYIRRTSYSDGEETATGSTFINIFYNFTEPTATHVTATITDTNVNATSEFAPCVEIVPLPELEFSTDVVEITEDADTDATYTIALASRPNADTKVEVLPIDTSIANVIGPDRSYPPVITFTTANWSQPQTITVITHSDEDVIGATNVIRHSVAIGDDDHFFYTALLNTRVIDDDIPIGLTLTSTTSGTSFPADVSEGYEYDGTFTLEETETATYTVVMDAEPEDDVTIDITSQSIEDLTVSPTSITFTRTGEASGADKFEWNSPQTVTINALDDSDIIDENVSIEHEVTTDDATYVLASIGVDIADLALPRLVFDPADRAVTVNEGETATYTVALDLQSDPGSSWSATVEVEIDSSASTGDVVTISPQRLTFMGGSSGTWDSDLPVTVTALVDDDAFEDFAEVDHTLTVAGKTISQPSISVTVSDENRAPTFNEGATATRNIDENSTEGTAVGIPVAATDLNNHALTYAITSQTGGPYTVDQSTGQIRVGAAPNLDYERRTTQRVNLKATDPGGLFDAIEVDVVIADVNEPPVISGSDELQWMENQPGNIARYTATDPERDPFEWSLSGTDAAFFSISDSGYLTFNDPPDFEASRGHVYELEVVATDSHGAAAVLEVDLSVSDLNEPPAVIGDTDISVDENTDTFARTYVASDPEGAGSTFTWRLSGADASDFYIDRNSGVLTFRNTPDYERPADSGGNNEYLISVRASDGQFTGTLNVKITVNDVDEAPEFTASSKSKTSFSYPENSAYVLYTYQANDPERGTVYWALAGIDDDDFVISEHGVLSFVVVPDFENPADSDGDNEYLVTVEARDDGFNTAKLDVKVNVTNAPGSEEPTITTTGDPSPFRENGTGPVYTFRASDPQGRLVSWRVTGADGHAFDIDSGGVLAFRVPPDFEDPADADRDNRYEIEVVVTDDQGLTDTVAVTVTVTNDDEGVEPTISTRNPPSLNRENGTSSLYTFRATDPQRQTINWTLGGADSGDFTMTRDNSGHGVLAWASPPDFEAPADSDIGNDYELTVIATDTDGHEDRLSFTIVVTDVDEGPEISRFGGAPGSVPENHDTATVLARYTATDPEDPTAEIAAWSTAGADGGDFVIDADGELRFRNIPDHEHPADSNHDNIYQVTIRASDGRVYGNFEETITVAPVDEPPSITTTSSSATALSQNENATDRLYTYRATDPENGALTWSVGGVDERYFEIDQQGQFSFSEDNPPDYEIPGDSGGDNIYDVTIQVRDDGFNTDSLNVKVMVREANEGPEIFRLGGAPGGVPENYDRTQVLATYTATDPEGGIVSGWRTSGTDGGDFVMNELGELRFRYTPDYERPADSNRDNTYEFTVQVSDGRFYGTFEESVTVTPINEPPTITTASTSATSLSQNENVTTRLYTYRASDPEGATTITWSVGGVDGRFFEIDALGQFSFKDDQAPDHEIPADSGGDNIYNATIRAEDDEFNRSTLDVTITVRAVNEGPEVTSGRSSFDIDENEDLPNAVYSGFDPEGGTVTRWTVGGTDGGDFVIAEDGTLTFRTLPDFERPADSNRDNIYELQVRPYDGRYYGSFDVTVTVSDVDEPPEIRSGSRTTFTQNENQSPRLHTYSAVDPEKSAVSWAVGGLDGRFFAIDERGQFSFKQDDPPDYEDPQDAGRNNTYEATIQVRDDGGNTASLPVTVEVREINEGPKVSGPSNFTISENEELSNAVYTASDDEGANVASWRVGGTDGGDFTITQGGTLSFRNPPDFERPADSNRDNVYEASIQPSDGRIYGSYLVTVTVNDVDEPPEIRRGTRTSFTQPENRSTLLYTFGATDPERGTIAWSISGTDSRFFAIDEKGRFSFDEDDPPDHDAPGDRGGENVYYVTIEARDPESNTAELPVTVSVTDIDEPPEITRRGNAPGSVPENQDQSRVLARYTATDPERPTVQVTKWSTSGRDAGDFVINALGELRFRISPDYERPADSNRDNVYEVTISASDGRNTGTMEEIQLVTVTDVDEPPAIATTSRTEFTQPENRATVLHTFRATDPEGGAITWSVGGDDGNRFAIDDRGQFAFSANNPPDFDNPNDLDGDNAYNATIEASDNASNTDRLEVTVTVTDLDEGVEPTISTRRPPINYQENRTSTVYIFSASDPQRQPVTWSLNGNDANAFDLTSDNSGRGVLNFRNPPDFENPDDRDRDNVYELAVAATDEDGNSDTVAFTITVSDHNEGEEPTISSRRPPTTYRENSTHAVYTFSASDPQRDSIAWSSNGDDDDDFSLTTDAYGRAVLTFIEPPDFENPADADRDNVYELKVAADDGQGNFDRVEFSITVTDLDEGPVIAVDGTATTTIPENTSNTQVLVRFTASDPEDPGAGIFRWATYGRDGGDFLINEIGELRFRYSPDFERPADADRNNVYEVSVRASDGRHHGTWEETLDITVTQLNEPPVITTKSRTEFERRENTASTIYTYRATDQDANDAVSWTVEGTDADDFAIYDGALSFRRLPDLEIPTDSDRDNEYRITIVASDTANARDTVDAVITITDQPEGPVISGTTSYTFAENYDITRTLGSYTATDAVDRRPVYPQWSLSGRDGNDFVIDRTTGALSFRNTPDYDRPADADRDNTYEVTVRAHDSRAYGYLNLTVAVTNINEWAPVVTGRTSLNVRENTETDIYTFRATDSDLNDTFTWSTTGADGHLFEMSERGGLSFRTAPNYEAPKDTGGDNVYELEVVATDRVGLQGGLDVTINVTELNEGPVVSGTSTFAIDENQDLANATYTARDPEADSGAPTTITWRLSGRDGGDFNIGLETGVLTFRHLPDYERPADYDRDNVYEVTVRAYDGRTYGDRPVTVAVRAVDEGPAIFGRDTFTYRENSTYALYTYRATDPEGDDFSWDLGGPDAIDFEISPDAHGRGILTFASHPDFDSPAGSGKDANEYLVTVLARDVRGNTGELPVTVTVTDLDEGAVVSGRVNISVQENHDAAAVLATYSASDPERQPITRWSLSGSDGGDFLIDETGHLSFRNSPDYDRPADSNRDNEYRIKVRAYDGRAYGNLDVTITVGNINEHDPVVRSGSRTSFTYREEGASVLYTYHATDQDKDDTINWTTGGADGSLFEFNDRNGLVFRDPPDHENPRDAGRDNVYDLTVIATDSGGRSATLAVIVTVTAVDEGPEISGIATYTLSEGRELVGATFTARDPENPSVAVANWRTSGTDGGDFLITQDGVLSFRNTPDFERPADSNRDNVYLVTVQVSDGRYYGSLPVTVTVTDINEAVPVVSGRDSLRVSENYDRILYTYSATDMDRGATIDWSLRGSDSDDFTFTRDAHGRGQLAFATSPDHELPDDSNSDNVYEITVIASDGSNEGTLDVTVAVTEINEGPEISGKGSINVSENHDPQTTLATYTATDPEDPTLEITRWSASGRDGGDFTINSDGELSFRYPPDSERPADADRDNIYEVTLRSSDGRAYGYYDITVTVEPVDEPPEYHRGSRSYHSYRENATYTLATYSATDPEGADVAWSLTGDDAADFDIAADAHGRGAFTFKETPDYDAPADHDRDNRYELNIVASDQTGNHNVLAVTVNVSNSDEGPIISGTPEFTVRENHDTPLGTYSARDPEIPTLEITRWSLSGRDGSDFTISDQGQLNFRIPPDSERPADGNRDNVYEVVVRASDGRYYGTFDVSVTVEPVNEPPNISGDDSIAHPENSDRILETYRAIDPEGSDIFWRLSGADAQAFSFEHGVLTFNDPPDFEFPSDSNNDNTYHVTVEATDEDGVAGRLAVDVTVTNITD